VGGVMCEGCDFCIHNLPLDITRVPGGFRLCIRRNTTTLHMCMDVSWCVDVMYAATYVKPASR
jgi:hypothetical protein